MGERLGIRGAFAKPGSGILAAPGGQQEHAFGIQAQALIRRPAPAADAL